MWLNFSLCKKPCYALVVLTTPVKDLSEQANDLEMEKNLSRQTELKRLS